MRLELRETAKDLPLVLYDLFASFERHNQLLEQQNHFMGKTSLDVVGFRSGLNRSI